MGVLLLLPLVEFATLPQPDRKVEISPFFTRLASEPGDFGILELPITSHYLRDHVRMFNQTIHHKKIIGGYLARRIREYYLDATSPFYQFIDLPTKAKPDIVPPMSAFAILNYYNIPYVVFYKQDESYERPDDKPQIEAYLRSVFPDSAAIAQDDDQITAYRVPKLPETPALVWAGNGWEPAETEGARTWRWSDGKASLHVATKTPLNLSLKFTSATFRGDAHLDMVVNGKQFKRFDLTQALKQYDAGTLELPPGQSEITFISDAKPITPIEAGASTRDDRKLGFLMTGVDIQK